MRERLALAIENLVVDSIHGIAGVPGRIFAVCRETARLLADSFDGAPGGRHVFEGELKDLIAPHLAVLAHKRARMFVPDDEGAIERWFLDLRCFMDRSLLPIMGTERDYAERNRGVIIDLLDGIIAREQNNPIKRISAPLLPHVTPFDSSWVT